MNNSFEIGDIVKINFKKNKNLCKNIGIDPYYIDGNIGKITNIYPSNIYGVEMTQKDFLKNILNIPKEKKTYVYSIPISMINKINNDI